MSRLKILDKYILKGYLPLLLMTFLICWFIVLMQFLWKYVDELVGKGLSPWVIGQTIYYAAMTLLPLALPLGILLASLMFFGQIGERLELLAMKASGMPLYRIMAPIFATVALLSIGLLYFQNTYMITSQVRMWTLIYSARYAKPELEIPERAFYNGIPGYSIYVGQRDRMTEGLMHNIMIYDHQGGNEKTRIIRADSGRIVMDSGQKFLTWKLHNGQSFENMSQPDQTATPEATSYAKERFAYKEIVIAFDANFNMQDENDMRNRFVGKNLQQLEFAIDTTTMRIDSIRTAAAQELIEYTDRQAYTYDLPSRFDTTAYAQERRHTALGDGGRTSYLSIDSLMRGANLQDSLRIFRSALAHVQQIASESEGRLYLDKEAFFYYRTNRQEWHRKFTFPIACLVFFFIGAPLGAIIRKGGLGMPVVVAIGFFIIYYIIDTFGHNMINTEKMGVVLGMWISTFVLLPIGALLTWQATRDSATLNVEAYGAIFKRLLGMSLVRKVDYPEMAFRTVDYDEAREIIADLKATIKQIISSELFVKPFSPRFLLLESWVYSPTEDLLEMTHHKTETLVKTLSYSREPMTLAKLQDMPILMMRLFPWNIEDKPIYRTCLRVATCLLPLSIPILIGLYVRMKNSRRDLTTMQQLLIDLDKSIDEERSKYHDILQKTE